MSQDVCFRFGRGGTHLTPAGAPGCCDVFGIELCPSDRDDEVQARATYSDGTSSMVVFIANAIIEHGACVSGGIVRWTPGKAAVPYSSQAVDDDGAAAWPSETVMSLGIPRLTWDPIWTKICDQRTLVGEDWAVPQHHKGFRWMLVEVRDDTPFTFVGHDGVVSMHTRLSRLCRRHGQVDPMRGRTDDRAPSRRRGHGGGRETTAMEPCTYALEVRLDNVQVQRLTTISSSRLVHRIDIIASHLRPDDEVLGRVRKRQRTSSKEDVERKQAGAPKAMSPAPAPAPAPSASHREKRTLIRPGR